MIVNGERNRKGTVGIDFVPCSQTIGIDGIVLVHWKTHSEAEISDITGRCMF